MTTPVRKEAVIWAQAGAMWGECPHTAQVPREVGHRLQEPHCHPQDPEKPETVWGLCVIINNGPKLVEWLKWCGACLAT